MTPQTLLDHTDTGQLWSEVPSDVAGFDMPSAYQQALAVRALRIARGETPRGFKIGFTNRQIWARYNVFAPIWGTVWNTTLSDCDGQCSVSLQSTCQPRLEPETVFGMKRTPSVDASMEDLFDALDWIAPGFEVIQSHLPDWKFKAADTVADGGLHARLIVGRKIPVAEIAASASELTQRLASARVSLRRNGALVEEGAGANVLDSPLHALHHFLVALRQCPGAPELMAGDVVTTGTWTDAWPLQAGDHWTADFSSPLSSLALAVL